MAAVVGIVALGIIESILAVMFVRRLSFVFQMARSGGYSIKEAYLVRKTILLACISIFSSFIAVALFAVSIFANRSFMAVLYFDMCLNAVCESVHVL